MSQIVFQGNFFLRSFHFENRQVPIEEFPDKDVSPVFLHKGKSGVRKISFQGFFRIIAELDVRQNIFRLDFFRIHPRTFEMDGIARINQFGNGISEIPEKYEMYRRIVQKHPSVRRKFPIAKRTGNALIFFRRQGIFGGRNQMDETPVGIKNFLAAFHEIALRRARNGERRSNQRDEFSKSRRFHPILRRTNIKIHESLVQGERTKQADIPKRTANPNTDIGKNRLNASEPNDMRVVIAESVTASAVESACSPESLKKSA